MSWISEEELWGISGRSSLTSELLTKGQNARPLLLLTQMIETASRLLKLSGSSKKKNKRTHLLLTIGKENVAYGFAQIIFVVSILTAEHFALLRCLIWKEERPKNFRSHERFWYAVFKCRSIKINDCVQTWCPPCRNEIHGHPLPVKNLIYCTLCTVNPDKMYWKTLIQ